MTPKAVEIIRLRPRAGVSDEEVLAASARVDALMLAQPGLLRRVLARIDGGWIICLDWRSREDAETGARAFGASPEAAVFRALFEPGSIQVLQGETRSCVMAPAGV